MYQVLDILKTWCCHCLLFIISLIRNLKMSKNQNSNLYLNFRWFQTYSMLSSVWVVDKDHVFQLVLKKVIKFKPNVMKINWVYRLWRMRCYWRTYKCVLVTDPPCMFATISRNKARGGVALKVLLNWVSKIFINCTTGSSYLWIRNWFFIHKFNPLG